jgi:hypothetical protein
MKSAPEARLLFKCKMPEIVADLIRRTFRTCRLRGRSAFSEMVGFLRTERSVTISVISMQLFRFDLFWEIWPNRPQRSDPFRLSFFRGDDSQWLRCVSISHAFSGD